MSFSRREFITLAVASVAARAMASTSTTYAATKSKIKAIAFDAFPVFDPRPIFALTEQLFPGKGTELSNSWRTRQFE